VCDLIEAGHTGALDYGFSFFLEVAGEHAKIEQTKMQNMAIAMRYSQADAKHFMRFISNKSHPGEIKKQGISGYQYFKGRMAQGKRRKGKKAK
jgi:hypothetical protein